MDGMTMEMNEAMLSLLMGKRRRGSETFTVESLASAAAG
jgi:hypothetical protein